MRILLLSDQFTFDAERAFVNTVPTDGTVEPVWFEAPCRKNVIAGATTMAAGPIDISLHDCRVESKRTGAERRVAAMIVRGDVIFDSFDPEVGRIELPSYSFLRVVFLDEDGQPRRDGGRVGVMIPNITFEAEVNPDGHFDVLVPAGPVLVHALSPRGTEECLAADAAHEDLGVVQVRAHRSTT